MKKILFLLFMGLILLMGFVQADWTPTDDINLRGVYNIQNATTINASGNVSSFSGWFEGLFNWTIGDLYFTFTGSSLTMDTTQLNLTIDNRILTQNTWNTNYTNQIADSCGSSFVQGIFDNGSFICGIGGSSDATWVANYSAHNDTWSSTYNSTTNDSINNYINVQNTSVTNALNNRYTITQSDAQNTSQINAMTDQNTSQTNTINNNNDSVTNSIISNNASMNNFIIDNNNSVTNAIVDASYNQTTNDSITNSIVSNNASMNNYILDNNQSVTNAIEEVRFNQTTNDSINNNIIETNNTLASWVDLFFPRFTELVSEVGNWTLDKVNYYTITQSDAQNTSQINAMTDQNTSQTNYIDFQNMSVSNALANRYTKAESDAQNTSQTTAMTDQNTSQTNYINIQNTSVTNALNNRYTIAQSDVQNTSQTNDMTDQNTSQTNHINLNNVSMGNYVDSQDILFNDSVNNYILDNNNSVNNYIVDYSDTNNDSMKTYVDIQNTSQTNYIDDQNTSVTNALNNRYTIAQSDAQNTSQINAMTDQNTSQTTAMTDQNTSQTNYIDKNNESMNNHITDALSSTTLFATYNETIDGTYDDGNITSFMYINDGMWYNVSEDSGSNPLEVMVNFTGITEFDRFVMKEQYFGGLGHEIIFEIYHVGDDDWEQFLEITDQGSMVETVVPVIDPESHINATGFVSVRFRHAGNGVGTHDLFIDYLVLINGSTVFTTTEHDALSGRESTTNHPWALDRGGTIALTANWAQGAFNLTTATSWFLGWVDSVKVFRLNETIDSLIGINNVSVENAISNNNDSMANYVLEVNATNTVVNAETLCAGALYLAGNGTCTTDLTGSDATWVANWTAYNTTWSTDTDTFVANYSTFLTHLDWPDIINGTIWGWIINSTAEDFTWAALGNGTMSTVSYADAQNTSQTNYINIQNTSVTNALAGKIAELHDDTTPQLGGYLDTDGENIGATDDEIENIYMATNSRIYFGDGQEFSQYYNGTFLITGG